MRSWVCQRRAPVDAVYTDIENVIEKVSEVGKYDPPVPLAVEEGPLARAAETKILRISYCVILTLQPQKWSQNDDLQLAATVTPLVHAIFFTATDFLSFWVLFP